MALEDTFIDLSLLNAGLVNLTPQDFVNTAILPMISLTWAFFVLFGQIRMFRGSKIPRIIIAGVFAFTATFFFNFGYFGFWVGMMGVIALGVRGILWKAIGLGALFILLTYSGALFTQAGIANAIGGFMIAAVLVKVRSNVAKVVLLGLILTGMFLANTIQLEIPVSYGGIPL